MKVVERAIKDVKPYENNPRKNKDAVEYVANSIKEFGFQQPIVVDKDGVIVAGHTRYLAAMQLGLNKVPVVVADKLSDEQVKAYRLADNKTNEQSFWDFDLLDVELEGIEGIDMEDFGFFLALDDFPDDITDDVFEEKSAVTTSHICPKCGYAY